jgi:hypothetical protein
VTNSEQNPKGDVQMHRLGGQQKRKHDEGRFLPTGARQVFPQEPRGFAGGLLVNPFGSFVDRLRDGGMKNNRIAILKMDASRRTKFIFSVVKEYQERVMNCVRVLLGGFAIAVGIQTSDKFPIRVEEPVNGPILRAARNLNGKFIIDCFQRRGEPTIEAGVEEFCGETGED